MAMDWDQWLRLFVILAMMAGAWRAWKTLPRPLKLEGRRYYPQSDGGFTTIWGRPVRDPAILAALERMGSGEGRKRP